MRWLTTVLMAFVVLPVLPRFVAAQAAPTLAPNTHIDTTLHHDAHRYQLRLRHGESVALVVDQRGVDVVVEVRNSYDSLLQSIDSPNGRQGPEPVEIFSPEGGTYVVRVRPFDESEPEGRYALDVTAWRDAGATRALLTARRLARDSAASWLRAHSAPLDSSLAPLEALARRAIVIGLGEATHGSREFGDVRLRLTRHLVERMHYRIVAIEASMSRLAILDRYARGEIAGGDSVTSTLEFGWIGRRALRELVTWLRQWNGAHPSDQVHLVGLDPQDNEVARRTLRAFLARAYPEAVERYATVERELAAADSQTWVFGNSSVDSSARSFLQELLGRLETDAPLLRKTIDSSSVRGGVAAARELFQFADFNSANNVWSRSRDWHMAANLLAAMEQIHESKAVYWAHNAHVAAPSDRSPAGSPMGTWLRTALGCGYAAVAVTFDSGGFVAQIPNDLEDRLAINTLPRAPDETIEGVLRTIRPRPTIAAWECSDRVTAPDWLRRPQRMHWVGGLFRPGTDPVEAFRTFRLVNDFDGVVFIPRVTADEVPRDRPLIPARDARRP